MRLLILAASTLMGAVLMAPNHASAGCGCQCTSRGPATGRTPVAPMPVAHKNNGHGEHKAPAAPHNHTDLAENEAKTKQVTLAVSGMT